ncbi:MAG: zinc dependent phospholipase C family protein, partial [Anaerolineae bacterium]|nr:zinc dependent phospholipase C family protein [Anaerolineae bacterium]
MTTWISHLRIAENLLAAIPFLHPEQFGIGNIAPDSGIPDENWANFDPPKQVTHFEQPGREPDFRHLDMDFYRRYLQPVPWPSGDAQHFSFLLGYFFHLITDNLWIQQVWRPTKARWLDQFESTIALGHEVKGDWYGLDFIYVRDHPASFYWRVFLDSEYPQNYLDFMPDEAVPRNMTHIKEWYQTQDDEIKALYARPYTYLPKTEMDQFVVETTQTLQRIYNLIWTHNTET